MGRIRERLDRIGQDLAVATYGRSNERVALAEERANTAVTRALAAVNIGDIVAGVVAEISNDGQNRTEGVLLSEAATLAIHRFSEAAVAQSAVQEITDKPEAVNG